MKPPPRGLFLGVTSVDIVHLVDRLPAPNEKRAGLDLLVTTGGPVTTAAVTFAWLGGRAHVVSALGRHLLAEVARGDLAAYGVRHTDLTPDRDAPPHTVSVLVTAGTGERALVYRGLPAVAGSDSRVDEWVAGADVLLVDGHQLPLSIAAACAAGRRGVAVVLDAGSWRDGLDELLAGVDYAVCAETFRPPGCASPADTFRYLAERGVTHRAVTRGPRSILCDGPDGEDEVPVPTVARMVDTLGAGDVFHGAFCYHLLAGGGSFSGALAAAARVAARSCTTFGPRAWMDEGEERGDGLPDPSLSVSGDDAG